MVNWGTAETQENHQIEQTPQEQVHQVKPTEPVVQRIPTNHISEATFAVQPPVTEEPKMPASQITGSSNGEGNVHSSNWWNFIQNQSTQGETN